MYVLEIYIRNAFFSRGVGINRGGAKAGRRLPEALESGLVELSTDHPLNLFFNFYISTGNVTSRRPPRADGCARNPRTNRIQRITAQLQQPRFPSPPSRSSKLRGVAQNIRPSGRCQQPPVFPRRGSLRCESRGPLARSSLCPADRAVSITRGAEASTRQVATLRDDWRLV